MILIGAGPGGSGLAAALARRGWRTLLLERGELPRHRVCGEFLSPEAVGSLERLGLRLAGAVPIRGVALSGPGGEALRFGLRAPGWGLSRLSLDHQLVAAARQSGAEVRTGVTVVRLERGEGWRLHLRESDPVVGRLVVGAWGRAGLPGLRTAVAAAGGKEPPRFVGVKLHLSGIAPAPLVELACFAGGYGGLAPIEEGRTNLALLLTAEGFRASAASPEMLLAALPDLAPGLAPRLWGAQIVPESWRVIAGVATERPNRPWDGLPLVGDAATVIPPLVGEGMAMALGSAALLLEPADSFLRGEIDEATLASSYSRAWRRNFGLRLAVGRYLQGALLAPGLAGPLIHWGGRLPGLGRILFGLTRGRTAAL